jgi:hypothetical protein
MSGMASIPAPLTPLLEKPMQPADIKAIIQNTIELSIFEKAGINCFGFGFYFLNFPAGAPEAHP